MFVASRERYTVAVGNEKSGLRIVGWGPFALPGERRRMRVAEERATAIMDARERWRQPSKPAVDPAQPPATSEEMEHKPAGSGSTRVDSQEARAYALKEQLLIEAETINASDQNAARDALRSIAVRWEQAEQVLRERNREQQARFDHFRSELEKKWRHEGPGIDRRIDQLRERVAHFETVAANARIAGDAAGEAHAEGQAQTWREWLANAEGAVQYERSEMGH